MMKIWILTCCFVTLTWGQSPLPQVKSGRLERINDMASVYVDPRNIDVCLPKDYTPTKKYAVLYMHDGQMLYDAKTTWNKQTWDVDDDVQDLMEVEAIVPTIVVGIWNHPEKRHAEYFPQKPYESLSPAQQAWVTAQLREKGRTQLDHFQPISDNYLKFIVKELKPYIDKTYSTYTDAAHTFVAGSSMGGLISWYTLCEYPEVFGGAACLSTHWPGVFTVENNPIPEVFERYIASHWPKIKNNHRWYMDCGDQTLDALYPPIQIKIDKLVHSKQDGSTPVFTSYHAGDEHSENAWKKRLHIPLQFLLSPQKIAKVNKKDTKPKK